MAFDIEIIKIDREEKNFFYYKYQFSCLDYQIITSRGKLRWKRKTVIGKLKIDKRNGDVHKVKLAEGDEGEYAMRASSILIKYWLNGEYPSKAYYQA